MDFRTINNFQDLILTLGDRVKETSTTTGTGTLNLGGAVTNFQGFVAGVGNGNTCYYAIVHQSAAEWETGIGTVTDAATDTLSRDIVLASSNSNSLVSLSAGTKDVFVTFPAAKAFDSLKDRELKVLQLLGSATKAHTFGKSPLDIVTNSALADGTIKWILVYLPVDSTLTGVRWYQVAQGNYTADNYNGVGLYSYSGGTLTLRASSTNDGNIWKGAATAWNNKDFSSTYNATAGIYYVALLYNQSAQVTAPTLGAFTGMTSNAVTTMDFSNSAKMMATLTSQTALPSPTQAISGLAGNAAVNNYVAVY